jgi:uroporphyrinogen decarboxylase
MTHRERLLATLRYESVDRVPDFEFSAWEQTIARWHNEGLPPEFNDITLGINDYFHTDLEGFDLNIGNGLFPGFLDPGLEYRVLEEKGDHLIVQDADGAIAEMMRPELGSSIPHYLRHAIATRADWEKLRDEKLNPDTPGRVPGDLEARCRESLEADQPVRVWAGSMYGQLRNWVGLEGISVAIMEDPEWVVEMIAHCTDLTLELLEKVAGKCRIDVADWWEDMCFNKGSLVSPRWFAEHMVPQYRRVTELLRSECGCEFNRVDCDGNIHQLIPLWLEAGVNLMFPLEAAHTDAYRIREQFGKQAPLQGYFDKRALIAGKDAIDREFERLRPLLDGGGFIPHTDHLVPPDVSWENYLYYRERKCAFIGREPEAG